MSNKKEEVYGDIRNIKLYFLRQSFCFSNYQANRQYILEKKTRYSYTYTTNDKNTFSREKKTPGLSLIHKQNTVVEQVQLLFN